MIIILLGKLRANEAIKLLVELLDDNQVNGHAIMALGYFKDYNLIKYIEPFEDCSELWIKKEALKAVKKIEQSQTMLIKAT